jgi:mRNA interferase MazF
VSRRYVPDTGDVVWLKFDPQAGHEQAGHRPAVVLSPASYNGKTSMLVCCPITTRVKGYPFEVSIAGTKPGVVLADQVKSFDWRARQATYKGRVRPTELDEVRSTIGALIGLEPRSRPK